MSVSEARSAKQRSNMNTHLTLNLHRIDTRKNKAKSTIVVDLLKKRGIAGTMAVRMFHTYSSEYLIRKNWLLDYTKQRGVPVLDDRRWLLYAIKNDYNESDDFLSWLERKKNHIIKTGDEDLIQLVSI